MTRRKTEEWAVRNRDWNITLKSCTRETGTNCCQTGNGRAKYIALCSLLLRQYSRVCFNERCYNEPMLQGTNVTKKECRNEGMPRRTNAATNECRDERMSRRTNAATNECRDEGMPRRRNAATKECRDERIPQRTVFINKIRMLQRTQMLQRTRRNTILCFFVLSLWKL